MAARLEALPPAWWTAVATGVAYLLVLGVLFVALFVVPYLVFVSM